MVITVHPRSKIGTPEPSPSRAKLRGVGWLLAHEVGVATKLNGGRYRSSDPDVVLDDAKAAAAYGVAAGKPWEYNWMLGRDGSIFTQAGEFVAAHCLDFNRLSAGVIWLNALGLGPTDAQVESWWFLRGHAVDIGVLAADHQVAPHYRFRATSCCGVLAKPPGAAWNSPTGEGRVGDLIDRLTIPTIPDPAPQEDDMPSTARLWRHPSYWNVFLIGAGPAINVSPELYQSYKAAGVPEVVEAHDQMLKTCLTQAGLTTADLIGAG